MASVGRAPLRLVFAVLSVLHGVSFNGLCRPGTSATPIWLKEELEKAKEFQWPL